jgi:hypothetical protein
VRHLGLCLILLVSTSACETSTDPFIGFDGGAGISQTQAAGNWSFTLHPSTTPACASGSLADGQVLTVHLDVLTDGTVAPSTSSWQNPPTTVVRPISAGSVVTLSSGFTDLFLAGSASSGTEMELRGTMNTAGSFSGTVSDPNPGKFPVFGVCSYSSTGVKTG